jgi:CII-binding regulator of phage lambda lysogenization HflD
MTIDERIKQAREQLQAIVNQATMLQQQLEAYRQEALRQEGIIRVLAEMQQEAAAPAPAPKMEVIDGNEKVLPNTGRGPAGSGKHEENKPS